MPATPAIAKPIPAAGRPANVPAPVANLAPVAAPVLHDHRADEDEATVVSQVPNEILGQLAEECAAARSSSARWARDYRRSQLAGK